VQCSSAQNQRTGCTCWTNLCLLAVAVLGGLLLLVLLLLSVHGCISLYVLRGGRGILVLVLILVIVLIVVLVLVLVVVVVVLILRCEEVSKEGKM
jgi:hypothetical protein